MNTTPRRSAVNTNDMLGLLMRDLDRYPMPNYDEQVELAKRVTAGDEEAKKQMVAANLRLVLHWARRYQDRGVEMVDLCLLYTSFLPTPPPRCAPRPGRRGSLTRR